MAAGDRNMSVEQGATWSANFTINRTSFDFTGYTTPRAKIKASLPDGAIVLTFVCAVTSAGVGQMVVNVSATKAVTAALTAPEPELGNRLAFIGYWDLYISNGTRDERIVQGKAFLSRGAAVT